MKEVKVFKRTILERTGFRKYPYREVTQITVIYGGKKFASNHSESIDNKRLKKPFELTMKTRSLKVVKNIADMKGCYSTEDKYMKETFQSLFEKIENESE